MVLKEATQFGLHIPRRAHAFGTNVLGQVGGYNRVFWQQTSELLVPSKTQKEFVRDLRVYGPLHDANVAFNAIEHGQKKDDLELQYFGGAMAVKAVVAAYEKSEIPSHITKRIVGGIIDYEIVPAEQPLLSDDLVERSEPPIAKYGKTVIDLFPSTQNRL